MCLGIPGRIISITDPKRKLAMVDVSGIQREINISCIVSDNAPQEQYIGDWVLVHVGFAMSRINEAEAAATLEILDELGEVQEELSAMKNSSYAPV